MPPEQKARVSIDALLKQAGWHVCRMVTGLVWEGMPDAAQLRTVLWGQLNDRHKVSSSNPLRDDDVRRGKTKATSLW